MSWQEGIAALIAGACALWVLWTTLRPFVDKVASACGMCPGCAAPTADAEADAPAAVELLQITPVDDAEPASASQAQRRA